jgi:hypothetical protein
MFGYWLEIIIVVALASYFASKKLPSINEWVIDTYVSFRDWRVGSVTSPLVPVETGVSAYPRARVIAFNTPLANLIPALYRVGPAIYDAQNADDIVDSHFIVAFRRKLPKGVSAKYLSFPIATTIVLRDGTPYWKLHGDPGSETIPGDPNTVVTAYRYVPIHHGDMSLAALAKAAGLVR